MKNRRGKTVAAIAALGFLGIAAVFVVRWEDIVAQVHLSRLRSEPNYLMEIIQEPEETPARKAVLRYVETDEGRRFLVSFCFRMLDSWWVRERKGLLQERALTSPLEYNKTAFVAQVDDSIRWKFSSQCLSISGNDDIFERIGIHRRRRYRRTGLEVGRPGRAGASRRLARLRGDRGGGDDGHCRTARRGGLAARDNAARRDPFCFIFE